MIDDDERVLTIHRVWPFFLAVPVLAGLLVVSCLASTRVTIECIRGAQCTVRSEHPFLPAEERIFPSNELTDANVATSVSSTSDGRTRTMTVDVSLVLELASGERIVLDDDGMFADRGETAGDAAAALEAFLARKDAPPVRATFGGYAQSFFMFAIFGTLISLVLSHFARVRIRVTFSSRSIVVDSTEGLLIPFAGEHVRVETHEGVRLEIDEVNRRIRLRPGANPAPDLPVPRGGLGLFRRVSSFYLDALGVS